MILVTVGNATQGFPRLLDAVDRIAGEGAFGGDAILVQSGHTRDFRPRHCPHQAFFPMEEFIALVHEASLVIAHAGAGTLFHVFGAGKIPVVMRPGAAHRGAAPPRLRPTCPPPRRLARRVPRPTVP